MASRRRSAYVRSARGSWHGRLRQATTDVHWTYGQATTDYIGPIDQVYELFLCYWVFLGNCHWLKKATFAAIHLLPLALQVYWEAAAAMKTWPMERAALPLRKTWLLSALTAAACRP
jgi:hypothetical protein